MDEVELPITVLSQMASSHEISALLQVDLFRGTSSCDQVYFGSQFKSLKAYLKPGGRFQIEPTRVGVCLGRVAGYHW